MCSIWGRLDPGGPHVGCMICYLGYCCNCRTKRVPIFTQVSIIRYCDSVWVIRHVKGERGVMVDRGLILQTKGPSQYQDAVLPV